MQWLILEAVRTVSLHQISYGSSRSGAVFLEGRAEVRYQQLIQQLQQHGMSYLRRVAMDTIGRCASGRIRGRPNRAERIEPEILFAFWQGEMAEWMML